MIREKLNMTKFKSYKMASKFLRKHNFPNISIFKIIFNKYDNMNILTNCFLMLVFTSN